MSKRLAMRAACASSCSVAPVGAIGSSRGAPIPKPWRCSSSSGISRLLDEDDVQHYHDPDRDAAQQPRRPPPQLVARVGVLLALLRAREAPHKAPQFLL